MNVSEISIDAKKGIAAEANSYSDGNGIATLVLRDFGALGWPYNQSLKIYLPFEMAGKAKRIADFINEVMAEPESRQFDDDGMFAVSDRSIAAE